MALEVLDSKNKEFWGMDLSKFAAKEHEKRVAAEKARKRIQAAVRSGTGGGRKALRGDESVLFSVSTATKESLVSSNNLLEHKTACSDAHKKWLAEKKKAARVGLDKGHRLVLCLALCCLALCSLILSRLVSHSFPPLYSPTQPLRHRPRA